MRAFLPTLTLLAFTLCLLACGPEGGGSLPSPKPPSDAGAESDSTDENSDLET